MGTARTTEGLDALVCRRARPQMSWIPGSVRPRPPFSIRMNRRSKNGVLNQVFDPLPNECFQGEAGRPIGKFIPLGLGRKNPGHRASARLMVASPLRCT